MANQVIVTNTGNVQVALTPPPNVQVQISRAAIGTVSNVPTANFANYAANVTSSNQPNITTVGTLGNLIVSGNTTVNNLTVTGNLVANVTVNTANYANFANIANTANSVAVANVFGIGNIATINLDGNAGNILYGNGSFAAVPNVANVANANYANFAGEAFSVSGSNVNGAVNLANFATTANAVAGANVSGTVANANFASYSEQSNNANLATYATTANAVAGANVSGQVANALVSGTVYTNAQPNITSVGNLTSLTSTGNITAPFFIGNVVGNISGNLVVPGTNTSVLFNQQGNAGASDAFQFNYATNVATITGNLSANYISGNGGGLSNIAGANVTGVVANANYAAYAGQANTANLATFATTANAVAGANVSGEVANANYASFANTANLATFATTANAVAGANVSGTVANANYSAFANVASVANSVAGANVSGEVANANYASFANIAASANSVTLANVSGAGNIASINLDGSNSNVLYGNGVFATITIPPGDQISNGTSNVSIPVANSNIEIYANTEHWTFADTGNLVLAGGNSVIKSIANSSLDILNPNVSTMVLTPDQGYTSQALVLDPTFNGHIHLRAPGANIDQPVANLYLGGEISSFEVGQFNGAVPNLFIRSNNQTWRFDIDGNLTLPANTFAINYANGTQVPLDGPVANANYANFAGTAYSVDGANVSGEVANANFASYANIAASANSVALANVSGIGNIANINLDGSSSNVLFGNGIFAPESTSIANANYANFAGTVVNATQSNITLLGTLTDLYMSNANVHLGTNTGANIPSTNRIAIGNGAAGGGTIVTHTFVAYDYGNGILTLDDTSSIVDGMYITGTGFDGTQVAFGVIDSTTCLADPPTSTPSGILTFNGAQGTGGIAIGANAGYERQSANSIAIGANAGYSFQQFENIAIGVNAGSNNQGAQAVAIGVNAGAESQSQAAFAMGNSAGQTNQGAGGVAIGWLAGQTTQGVSAIAIGTYSGNTTQSGNAIAIGRNAGSNIQGQAAIAIGRNAGFDSQGANAVAIGRFAGNSGQGANSVAIGRFAGTTNQAANSIILNATGANLNQTTANTFTVKPVRNANTSNIMYYNNSTGEISYDLTSNATVANANYANFAGTAYSVSGANVSGEVANANYASFANIAASANSVAVANVSGIGNIAVLNLDGSSSNVLFGNGVFAPESTSIANANYANFAGTVITNAQPNITSTGNLISLNIDNGVAGSTTKQFQPNGISIGSTANVNLMANSSFVDIDYGNGQGGGNVLLGKSQTFLKARGNASSITTANVSDRVGRTNYMFYNGTSNVLAAATHVNPGVGVTFNTNANAVTTAGQYIIITGNPNGDQGNANALSNQNVISADPFGRLQITQGAAGSTSVGLQINTYGGASGNGAAGTQNIFFARARGNRDGNLSVQPSDQLGGMLFAGWNGNSTFSTRTATIRAVVDSSYVANTANIPAGLQFITCDNTATYTTTFSANGSASFPGSLSTANGVTVVMNNINTVSSSFAFSTYNNANSLVNPYSFFRARGNLATPAAAQVNDTVSSITYNIYADAGNTFASVASTTVTVSDNDGAGNVASTYNVTAKTITLTGNVSANNVTISSATGFMKLSTYTAAALTAITGQVGWMAAVTNSAGGGNPNGMLAFWDTTNARWSYVHDNSAV